MSQIQTLVSITQNQITQLNLTNGLVKDQVLDQTQYVSSKVANTFRIHGQFIVLELNYVHPSKTSKINQIN